MLSQISLPLTKIYSLASFILIVILIGYVSRQESSVFGYNGEKLGLMPRIVEVPEADMNTRGPALVRLVVTPSTSDVSGKVKQKNASGNRSGPHKKQEENEDSQKLKNEDSEEQDEDSQKQENEVWPIIEKPNISKEVLIIQSKNDEMKKHERSHLANVTSSKRNQKSNIGLGGREVLVKRQPQQGVIQDEKPNNTHNVQLSSDELLKIIPDLKAPRANCFKLFRHDKAEIKYVFRKDTKDEPWIHNEHVYKNWLENCEDFKRNRGYITHVLSTEEEEFPLAFSILAYKAFAQVERLLRAIYMPQNYYCIHVDAKSPASFKETMNILANCFENVFVASKHIDVRWAQYSVLEADLVCMEEILKFKKWKYFINLTGQEFPLKTNLELVQILKVFNGSVQMEGSIQRYQSWRTAFVYDGKNPVEPRIKKSRFQHNITLLKGSVHVAVPRSFVEFVAHDPIALAFREWVKDTGVPDETFFASLGHSPQLGVPGAYKGIPETNDKTYPFLARSKNWYNSYYPCFGRISKGICIIGIGDLYYIKDGPELFVNKFHQHFSPSAYDCMEELHFKRIRDGLLGKQRIDLNFYKKFEFTWNHV